LAQARCISSPAKCTARWHPDTKKAPHRVYQRGACRVLTGLVCARARADMGIPKSASSFEPHLRHRRSRHRRGAAIARIRSSVSQRVLRPCASAQRAAPRCSRGEAVTRRSTSSAVIERSCHPESRAAAPAAVASTTRAATICSSVMVSVMLCLGCSPRPLSVALVREMRSAASELPD
jgi:hypothetical protein